MVTAISNEVGRVVDAHKARDAAWYNEVAPSASILHIFVVNPES